MSVALGELAIDESKSGVQESIRAADSVNSFRRDFRMSRPGSAPGLRDSVVTPGAAELEDEARGYDEQISALQTSLDCVKTKRAKALSARNFLVGSCRLPLEILSDIFVHCLPTSPLAERCNDELLVPMTLGQVCGFWRATALCTPCLWSHLHYKCDSNSLDGLSVAVIENIFVPRSGHIGLSMALVFISDRRGNLEYWLFDRIRASSRRWVYLYFDFCDAALEYISHSRLDLATLSTLEMYIMDTGMLEPHERRHLWDLRSAAPLLSKLWTLSNPLLLELPVSRLQDLRYELADFDEHHEVLSNCCNLERLEVKLRVESSAIVHPTRGHLTNPNLKEFNVTLDGYMDPVLSTLTLPNLRRLYFKFQSGLWAQSIFLDFLSRSQCLLASLTLSNTGYKNRLSEGDLIDILTTLPSLRTLSLRGAIYTPGTQLFGRLRYHRDAEDGAPLLPNLTEIDLIPYKRRSAQCWDHKALARMIQSRLPLQASDVQLVLPALLKVSIVGLDQSLLDRRIWNAPAYVLGLVLDFKSG